MSISAPGGARSLREDRRRHRQFCSEPWFPTYTPQRWRGSHAGRPGTPGRSPVSISLPQVAHSCFGGAPPPHHVPWRSSGLRVCLGASGLQNFPNRPHKRQTFWRSHCSRPPPDPPGAAGRRIPGPSRSWLLTGHGHHPPLSETLARRTSAPRGHLSLSATGTQRLSGEPCFRSGPGARGWGRACGMSPWTPRRPPAVVSLSGARGQTVPVTKPGSRTRRPRHLPDMCRAEPWRLGT